MFSGDIQQSWHSNPMTKISQVLALPIHCVQQPYLLQGHHIHCLNLSSVLPLLIWRWPMRLKCHRCYPMQIVGPAEHPPATAEPTPDFAPIIASSWSPVCVEGMKRSSSQGGDPEEGLNCADCTATYLSFLKLRLLKPWTVLLCHLAPC